MFETHDERKSLVHRETTPEEGGDCSQQLEKKETKQI
jgi:hypothetical protein